MLNTEEPGGSAEAGADGRPQILQVESEEQRLWFFEHITKITRVWSLITCAVLWGCSIKLVQKFLKYHFPPWHLLCVAVVFTYLEKLWILSKCECYREDGCCNCWRVLLWVDNWKTTVLCLLLSALCFFRGGLAMVCGVMVIGTAVFYLLKSFKDSV